MDNLRIKNLFQKISESSSVIQVEVCPPEWNIGNNKLRHSHTDYFNIGYYQEGDNPPCYLMEQRESALVLLLISTIDGRRSALLNLRYEPGLIGSVNLTTTIQSTPSNYQQKHGGKPTPFVDMAYHPTDFGEVIYDGLQFDWGDYYVQKTKRFLILDLPSPPPAPDGFIWLDFEFLKGLAFEDYMITNDLRVMLTLLFFKMPSIKVDKFENSLKMLPVDLEKSDSRGVRIGFFKTTSSTREVKSWVQPLLLVPTIKKIVLYFTKTSSGIKVAVNQETRIGLIGKMVFFPATLMGGKLVRQIQTSAEGGRFWKHEVQIELWEKDQEDGELWMDLEELDQCSLELNLAISLIVKEL
jgi:hypothetical protein